MSFINRNAARMLVSSTSKVGGIFQQTVLPATGLLNSTTASTTVRTLNRSLVVLSIPNKPPSLRAVNPSTMCSCGCGINGMHTRGDRELVEFLQDEIVAEKKNQSGSGKLSSTLDDFTVKGDGGDLSLTRSFQDETITIHLNVNHSVESQSSGQEEEQPPKEGDEEMDSRPDFEVDVKIGNRTLSITCQFMPQTDVTEGDHVEEPFGINELTFYEGEHSEKTYAVSGEILDGMLYDLFMNYLEERGVTGTFVEKLSTLCTQYEHGQYIGLLENVHDFVKRK